MNDREKIQEAKDALAQINHALATERLTAEEQEKLQLHAARLAGVILRPWLPLDWTRRLIMIGIVLLGLQQAIWTNNYQPFLWWFLLPFFSPRILGNCAYAAGSFMRQLRRSD